MEDPSCTLHEWKTFSALGAPERTDGHRPCQVWTAESIENHQPGGRNPGDSQRVQCLNQDSTGEQDVLTDSPYHPIKLLAVIFGRNFYNMERSLHSNSTPESCLPVNFLTSSSICWACFGTGKAKRRPKQRRRRRFSVGGDGPFGQTEHHLA